MNGVHDEPTARERIDRSCELLSSARRRHVIYALHEDGPSTVSELADALVASDLADESDRAMASLVHKHLPKMAEYGVIQYGDPDEVVSLAESTETLEPFLTAAAREEASGDVSTFADEGAANATVNSSR